MRYPLDIVEVTSEFGMRVHPITGVYKLHNGVDLKGSKGTPIFAIASGEVNKFFNSTGGNQITIKHKRNVKSGYAHLDQVYVVDGQQVKKGEVIGTVGTSGAVTGAHLHFTMRKDDELIDPISHIKKVRFSYGVGLLLVIGIVIYIFRKKIL